MTRVNLSHPRRKRLTEWLETGADERVTQHVEHCERCVSVLEELSEEGTGVELTPDPELADAIREAMSPPEGLNERVFHRVRERQRAERELSLFLDLIAIPRDAADLMMQPIEDNGRPPTAIEGPDDGQREEQQ